MVDIVCTFNVSAVGAYLDEEMSLQQKRREMHKSRPFRVWSSGEWCWFWRSRAHLHRRTKASRQFKEGAFLGPARVLLQQRERKRDDIKYKTVVWNVDGDQLVRCSSAHLRPVSTAEQTLCSLRDGEARTFQQVVRRSAISWILLDSPHQWRKISKNRWTLHLAMKS